MPDKTVIPVISTLPDIQHVCWLCRRNRILCECGRPYPRMPERGLYSRAMYNEDIEGIERIESGIDRLVMNSYKGLITGLEANKLQAICNEMRAACRKALFRTRMIMQERDDSSKAKAAKRKEVIAGPVTQRGVRFSTHEAETLRRIVSDPVFAENYFKERMPKKA